MEVRTRESWRHLPIVDSQNSGIFPQTRKHTSECQGLQSSSARELQPFMPTLRVVRYKIYTSKYYQKSNTVGPTKLDFGEIKQDGPGGPGQVDLPTTWLPYPAQQQGQSCKSMCHVTAMNGYESQVELGNRTFHEPTSLLKECLSLKILGREKVLREKKKQVWNLSLTCPIS